MQSPKRQSQSQNAKYNRQIFDFKTKKAPIFFGCFFIDPIDKLRGRGAKLIWI